MSAFFENTPVVVIDIIGIGGFGLYVLNYTLLTFGRVKSDTIAYFAINGVAAAMVLVGLSTAFNLASAMIQFFWIGISAIAIVIRLRRPARADALPLAHALGQPQTVRRTAQTRYNPAATRSTVRSRSAFGGWVPKN